MTVIALVAVAQTETAPSTGW